MQINYMENAIVPNLTLKIRTKYEHVPFPWKNTLVEADCYSGYIWKTHRHQYEHLLSLIKIYLGGDAPLFLVGSFAKYPPSNLDIEKFKSYSWLLEEGVEKFCPFILCLSFKEYPPPNLGG